MGQAGQVDERTVMSSRLDRKKKQEDKRFGPFNITIYNICN